MSEIVEVFGREVLDSRGNPTVEAEVMLLQAAAKPSSCAMEMLPATTARAFCKPLPTSTTKSAMRLSVTTPASRLKSTAP